MSINVLSKKNKNMSEKIEISNIIRKRTLGLVFVLGAASLAFAQQKLDISGKVVDTQNQPVPYASISFSNPQNKLYSDAALADDQGNYTLQLVPGNYNVTIEAIDYKKAETSRNISAAGKLENFIVAKEETATLTPTQDIQTVVITAQAVKPYKVELDKKTYDPSQDLVSKGGTLQDVLQNVPSVSVDTDGSVSMRGSSNIKFLINGKPSALLGADSGADALRSIPSDQIERIEVITNPSSKYEASGTAGILNIILKKTKGTGFNGSVDASLGYLPTTRLNTNLSWKKGSWNWYINGGGGYNEGKNTNNNDATFYDAARNVTEYSIQRGVTKSYNKNYNATAGFSVDLSEKTSLSASGMIRSFDNESKGTVNYQDFDYVNNLSSFSQRLSNGQSDNLSTQGDIALDHKFDDKGQNISFSLSLQGNKNNNESQITETENGAFLLANQQKQDTKSSTLIGRIDYELPIGENSKFEAGYRIDRNKNDYNYQVLERMDGEIDFTELSDYTDTPQYNEMFNAAYVQFRSKAGSFGYQVGLRDEMSNIDFTYKDTFDNDVVKNIKKSYNNLFPSVFLSYDLGEDKNNQILLNYSRRIDRPRSFFLIPFMSYNDNRNVFRGNPDLNPSYINSYELGYAIQKKKFTINPTLYLRDQQDNVQVVVRRESANSSAFVSMPMNIGTELRYGLDLNATADFFPWWKILANVDVFGYDTTGTFVDTNDNNKVYDFSGDGISTRLRLNNTFKLHKTFSVQLQGFYRGPQETNTQLRKEMYSISLGATKTILDGNGTIAFNIQDIFNTRNMSAISYGADFERNSYMQWQPRQFMLTFSYKFKQGEKVDQQKRRKDNNSNYNSGDDQQGPM